MQGNVYSQHPADTPDSPCSYTVTSNHVHLLVFDRGKLEIAAGMQRIEGRTAQLGALHRDSVEDALRRQPPERQV